MPDAEVVQVVMPPRVREAFEAWLGSRGLVLVRLPDEDPDDLPTYVIHPQVQPKGARP